jgi:hypothetical protein
VQQLQLEGLSQTLTLTQQVRVRSALAAFAHSAIAQGCAMYSANGDFVLCTLRTAQNPDGQTLPTETAS